MSEETEENIKILASSTVTIKHDAERRHHNVSGIHPTPAGMVAVVVVKKWGQNWVAKIPFEDLEEVE